MTPTKNPPVGVPPHATGSMDYNSSSGNVVPFPSRLNPASPFLDQITTALVIAQFRTNTLPEISLVALLVAAGLRS